MFRKIRALIAAHLAILGAGIFCLAAQGGPAAAQAGLATEWRGMYYYPSGDKRAPVPFTMHFNVTGTSFTGRTTEPATFGNGTSSQLFANVSGSFNGANISWIKTYDGTGGVSHSVNYRGSLSVDSTQITGAWNIGSFSGRFTATAQNAPAATGCLIPDKVFPKAGPNTVTWHFGNACDTERYVSVCVEYGNGSYNPLGANVPAKGGADIILLEGWANLTWKDGTGLACPAPK